MTAGRFRRLRVLAVAAREPWPLSSGARLHLYHVLEQLARRAEVTLALPQPAQHRDDLPAGLRVETMTGAATGSASPTDSPPHVPLFARLVRRHFGYNDAIEAWIRREARPERFDVALLNGAVLGQHTSAFHIPVVWNPQDELVLPMLRDAQFGSWRNWPTALHRAALYACFQRHVLRQAAATVYVSKLDAAYARRWAGAAPVAVVQNGVDLDYFRPSSHPAEPGTVAFVGSLEFPPNVDGIVHFTTRVWPRIYESGAGRRLLVVGRRPVAAVRALAKAPGVKVAADVSDVRPYLARAAVVVVPIRKGGGLKNKVLEGCAMRRPLVADPHALAGLGARVGVDLLSARQPQQWAERVGRLLRQPDYAQKLAQNGYDWVRRAHNWSTTGERFHEILTSARRASHRASRAGRVFETCRSRCRRDADAPHGNDIQVEAQSPRSPLPASFSVRRVPGPGADLCARLRGAECL